MNTLKPYQLPFTGLAVGHHDFDFDIGSVFFQCFPESEVRNAQVKISLDLEKQERLLILSFHIEGEVEVVCDRCAYEYMQPIEGDRTVFVKFGEEEAEEDDDVWVIPQDAHDLDLSSLLYDYIHLLIPYHRIHPDQEDGTPGCNPEMITILENLKPHQDVDPRWDALKDLRNDTQ